MATPNPIEKAYTRPPPPCSKKIYCIAGIHTTVYGLDALPAKAKEIACLWLLHPRLQTQASMEPIAFSTICAWNEHIRNGDEMAILPGLIAVAFDQRNHGTREINQMANRDWRSGNETHAQDMFANGTAVDTAHLIQYLPSYVFPQDEHKITNHMVCGVSLGGHAAWQCLISDPAVTAAISVVGCPDYIRLMTDRARLSKLPTSIKPSPPGSSFLGSKDFPKALVDAVRLYDPAGLVLSTTSSDASFFDRNATDLEKHKLLPIMQRSFRNKRMLNMSGGADKLVPYACSRPFLQWLQKAIAPSGWFSNGNFFLQDIVCENIGRAMSPNMAKEINRFVVETLILSTHHPSDGDKASKI